MRTAVQKSSKDGIVGYDGPIPGESGCNYACFGCCCPFIFRWWNTWTHLQVWRAQTEDGNSDAPWRYNASRGTVDGVSQGLYAGPEYRGTCVYSHALVKAQLQHFSTNELAGLLNRTPGYLGYTQYGIMWPEVPWKTIELGTTVSYHEVLRPLMIQLMGSENAAGWSEAEIADAADAFFEGRTEFDTDVDVQVWVQQQLHRILLGMNLSADEAKQIFGLFASMATNAFLDPFPSCLVGCVRCLPISIFDYKPTLQTKAEIIAKYREALRPRLPDEALDEDRLTQLASTVFDANLFAGGKSVVTVIPMLVQLPHLAWGQRNLPLETLGGEQLLALESDPTLRRQYVWETIRRWNPVGGFAYHTRSGKTIILDLMSAQVDPEAWGADSLTFKLRPLAEYAEKIIGFADFASRPGDEAWKHARACPGKDLALVLCDAFAAAYSAAAKRAAAEGRGSWKMYDRTTGERLEADEPTLSTYGVTTCVMRLTPDDTRSQPHRKARLENPLDEWLLH